MPHRGEQLADEGAIRQARILLVDDDQASIRLLQDVLTSAGFTNLDATTDPREVFSRYDEYRPDLVLLDLGMPYLDGYALLERLKERTPSTEYLPILVLTADITSGAKRKALAAGAKDFLTKPFDATEVVLRVRNLIETRLLYLQLQQQNDLLEERVHARTTDLWSSLQSLTASEAATRDAVEETIYRLALAAEFRDAETGWHIERMSRYSSLLAAKMGIDEQRCELIRLASSMHDVGKIGVSDRILLKKGPLTIVEFDAIKTHADIGYRILSESKAEVLQLAALIARTHHERFDGSGYPRGLQGTETPLEARIATIADVFDAITSNRVYRRAYPLGQALDLMAEGRGSHFDPELYDVFMGSLEEIMEIMQRYNDESIMRELV